MRPTLCALAVALGTVACGGDTGIVVSVTQDDSVDEAPAELHFVFGVLDDGLYLRDDFEAEDQADVAGRDLASEPYELLLHDSGPSQPSELLVAVFARIGDRDVGFAATAQPIRFMGGETLRHTLTLTGPATGDFWTTPTGCLGWDELVISSPTDRDCDGCDDVTGAGCAGECVDAGECETRYGAAPCGAWACNAGSCDVECADCADDDRDGYGVGDGCAGLDCDDDDDQLFEGVSRACYGGPPGTEGVGECRPGLETCLDGALSMCAGEVVPGGEACNGEDEDCDDQVDEDLGTIGCGLGACRVAAPACSNGSPGTCTPGPAAIDDSSCDGVDSDCDGAIDEDCPCVLAGPGGDDTAALGDGNVTPFATVQAAIDYAAGDASRPKVVCLAAGDCGDSHTFHGAVVMRDGIQVIGRYDLGRGRCGANTVTEIEPEVPAGIIFPASVQRATSLDGVRVVRDDSGTVAAGVSLDGARNVVLSNLEILDQPSVEVTWGVNLENGAEATITRSSIYGGDGTVSTVGVRSVGSKPTITNNCGDLSNGQCDTWCGTGTQRAIRGRYTPGAGAVYGVELSSSPGAVIDTSAVCGVNGARGAAVKVQGDATGTVIRSSLISAFGPTVASSAIRFEACGGASPRVTDNYSIDAAGAQPTTRVEAIHAEGDCHPVIERNRQIVGGNEGGTVSSTAVFCGSDGAAPSRCVLLDNPRISGSVANFPPQSTGVRCENGGCMRIERNVIDGFQGVDAVGLSLEGTAPLVANNRINGGCATRSATGLVAEDAAARIENNRIFAGNCAAGQAGNVTRYAALRSVRGSSANELDVHSNHIDGRGHVGPCTSRGVLLDLDPVGAPAATARDVFRNNIVIGGQCATAYGVEEVAVTTDPRVLENNDLVPNANGSVALYRDEGTSDLFDIADVNALLDAMVSANIAVDPMQTGYPAWPALSPASACIDAGTTAGAPAVDQDGDPRDDGAPDIGPDEI